MTPLDLNTLTEEIMKTKNWSHHRKSLYGMGVMHELYIADGSVSEPSSSQQIIPASDRAVTAQVVTEALDHLVEYDEIEVFDSQVNLEAISCSKMHFPHILMINDQPGIQYILNSHLWLKVMNDTDRTLALVVTGDIKGSFTFYLENTDGNFKKATIPFRKNGIYQLTKLSVDTLYLKENALKLD